MNKIAEEQFYNLLSLKLSGDASVEELTLLQQQLIQHPQLQFLYDQMMQPPSQPLNQFENTQQAYAAHFVKMQLAGKFNDIPISELPLSISSKTRYKKILYFAVAASIIGIIFFTEFIKSNSLSNRKTIPINEIATKKGSKSNIKLPDGTLVWLNADSKLTYTENFSRNTREVNLLGEAYFDVAHDTAHPFIIHSGKANIKVLGTAFNVRNYLQDKTLETTLMRGKIEVWFTDRPEEKIIMKPLEKLIVRKEIDASTVKNKTVSNEIVPAEKIILTSVTYSNIDSIISETSWLDDKMVFINQPLEKIAQELERNFDITVIFKNNDARSYRYTGVFNNVSLEKVLHILHLSNNEMTYKIVDKNVIIY